MLSADSLFAFCRTRTCGAKQATACEIDPITQCATNGAALYWPEASFDFWVDPAGSPRRGITGQDALAVLKQSLKAWTDVACASGSPSIAVGSIELMADAASVEAALQPSSGTVTDPAANTSVLTFVDEGWSGMSQDAIALTTMFFGTQTGRIIGADIELDAEDFDLTLPEAAPNFDLLSVLTHESGHVLGLDHPSFEGPTMFGRYDGDGDLSFRSLESDDVAGICTIYPPDRFDPPSGCGCVFPRNARHPTAASAVVCAIVYLAFRRKSSASRRPVR